MRSSSQPPGTKKAAIPWLLALLMVLLCLASFLADDTVASFFKTLHSLAGDSIARVLNCVGDWPVHSAVALLAAGVAWRLRRKELSRLLLIMILASSMAGIAVNTVRLTSGRPRPSTPVRDGFYGLKKDGKWNFRDSHYQSFPSAHTATATAFACVALFAGIRGGWLIALFGPLVGCARIYSGAHHFSDVVTAIFLGMMVARWAWKFAERKWPVEKPETVSPVVSG